jgi:hypothetical protein
MNPYAMMAQAAGSAAGIGANLIGHFASAGDRAKANQLMNEAAEEILTLGAPPETSREIILRKFEQAGMLTPELEQGIDLEASQAQNIQEDPALRDAQMGALEILSQRSRGGLTPEDRAAINAVRSQVAGDTNAQDASILQNMAQRGMGGAGNELAARLMSSQAGSQRASEEGDRLAAIASQNALSAVGQMGNLSGNIRAQDFSNEEAKAQAADAVARFNTENAISRQTRNVGSQNAAEGTNVARQQTVSDANVGSYNAEQARQRAAELADYQAKLSLAQMRSGAKTGLAGQSSANAAGTQKLWSNIGSSLSQAGSGASTMIGSK